LPMGPMPRATRKTCQPPLSAGGSW
jgi:hypothetical protein